VVEDDAMFRGLLAQMLLGHGYRVLAAANPAQALEIAAGQRGNIRLLLSDMVMPGGTGADLAARLREEIGSLKVILMSGYTDEGLISRDLDRTHADAFLEKPFATAELLRQIRLLLSA
jgi:CheY-like chemotaxis protein